MDSIIKELEQFPTTCISDALKGMNNLDSSIKPVKNDLKVVGRAFTVKIRAADNKLVLHAIRDAKPGDVLVVDAKGYMNNAVAGDFILSLAKLIGISGVVIDGVVRDIAGIRALDFPVFCKGTTTAASDKHGSGEIGVPISCGNVVINPGDIIVGDEDGVVCIPQSRENEILEKAKAKLEQDKKREETYLQNAEKAKEYLLSQ